MKKIDLTGSEAMDDVENLFQSIRKKLLTLGVEVAKVEVEWEGLKNAGGGRDDHAVNYLRRVTDKIVELRDHASRCIEQLEVIIADPFGDKRNGNV